MGRKRLAARMLQDRVGEQFHAVVSGASRTATWIKTIPDGVEGRLVRGRHGLKVGDEMDVVLLAADPVRGFIDFSNEAAVVPAGGTD